MTLQERKLAKFDRIVDLGHPPPWWRFAARRRWMRELRAIMTVDVSEFAETLRSIYSEDAIVGLGPFIPSSRPGQWQR